MAVQGRLKAPIDAEEFQFLRVVLDRRIEEVEVENRTDDVPFDPRVLQVLFRDDALFQQGLGLLAEFRITRGREEAPFELLDLVGELDDREAVDVPRLLELLRGRQLGLLEDPVVALLEFALFRTEEIATPEDRDPEIVLDGIQVDVGGEGPVRDEDATHAPKVLLKFRGEDLFEFSEDDRLVHRPAHRASVLVPHGAEVARVRSFAAFLAEHEGAKALFDCAVADVQRGVRPDRRDADLRRIVAFEHLHNLLALDHRGPCLEPMRCPSIILCCGSQSLTMRSHRFPGGTAGQRLYRGGLVSSTIVEAGPVKWWGWGGRTPWNRNGPRALPAPNYRRGRLGRAPGFETGARPEGIMNPGKLMDGRM